MRPAGDVHLALLQSAHQLGTATLREMVHHSQVSQHTGRSTVRDLKRYGHLHIVDTRRVDYRNRPVAVYAPAPKDADLVSSSDWTNLGCCLDTWR